jgi:hypothetical protein
MVTKERKKIKGLPLVVASDLICENFKNDQKPSLFERLMKYLFQMMKL